MLCSESALEGCKIAPGLLRKYTAENTPAETVYSRHKNDHSRRTEDLDVLKATEFA